MSGASFMALLVKGGGAAVSWTAAAQSAVAGTSYSFATQSIGAAAADRYIAVAIMCRNNTDVPTISAVTVAGNSMTQVVTQTFATTAGGRLSIYVFGPLAAGTTATIAFTTSSTLDAAISVYRLSSLVSGTAAFTASAQDAVGTSNPIATTINVPASGILVAVAGAYSGSGTFTWSGTGLTEDSDVTWNSAPTLTSASGAYAASQTALAISADPSAASPTFTGIAAASWS